MEIQSSESTGMVTIVFSILFIVVALLFMKSNSRGGGGGGGGSGTQTPEPNPTVSNVKINSISVNQTESTIPSETVNVKLEIIGTPLTTTITKGQLQSTFNWSFGSDLGAYDTDYTLKVTYLPSNLTRNINFRVERPPFGTPGVTTIRVDALNSIYVKTTMNLRPSPWTEFINSLSIYSINNPETIISTTFNSDDLYNGKVYILNTSLQEDKEYKLTIDVRDEINNYEQIFNTRVKPTQFSGTLMAYYSDYERISNLTYKGILETDEFDYQIVDATNNTVLYTKPIKQKLVDIQTGYIQVFPEGTINSFANLNHYIRLRFYEQGKNAPYFTYDTNSIIGNATTA